MAAPTVRASTRLSGVAGTSAVVVKPTGTVDGDVLYVALYVENTATRTVPSGWTLVATSTCNATADIYQLQVYEKRASSEGASWTWSWTGSAWREAQCICVSGAATAGGFDEQPPTTAKRDTIAASTFPSVSIITYQADCLVLWFGGNYGGASSASTMPTGFTAVLNGTTSDDIISGKLSQATAATVTASGATYAAGGSGPTNAVLIAVRSANTVYRLPTATEQDGTTTLFTNPTNVTANDGVGATCGWTMPVDSVPKSVRGTTFNFDTEVLSGATISNVTVYFKYKVGGSSGSTTGSSGTTYTLRPYVGGTATTTFNSPSPRGSDTYGSYVTDSVDITSARTWTQSDLTNSNLKLAIEFQFAGIQGTPVVDMDYFAVSVTYSGGGGGATFNVKPTSFIILN